MKHITVRSVCVKVISIAVALTFSFSNSLIAQDCLRAMSAADRIGAVSESPEEAHTISDWQDIAGSFLYGSGESGFGDFLRERYGNNQATVEKKARQYAAILKEAEATGMYTPDKPVVITATPGRIRVFGGHPDAKGINVNAVNMATTEEILMVTQASDDRDARVVSADRGEKTFSMDSDEVMPDADFRQNKTWVEWARARRPKITNRETDWDLFPKAVAAYYQWKYFGEKTFSGLRIYIGETDLPIGGVSSSSAVVMGINYALDALYGLGQSPEELARNGNNAEYEYTYVRAGGADQFAIALGKRDEILNMSNAPEKVEALVHFPETVSAVFFNSGISRDDLDLRTISPGFAGEFGDAGIGNDKSLGSKINNRSGSSAALAALWLRHAVRGMIDENSFPPEFTPEEVAQLRNVEEGMTSYETKTAKVADNQKIGFFRELLDQGACAMPEAALFKLLKLIPSGKTYDELRAEMPEFQNQVLLLIGEKGVTKEPPAGFRLREAALYALSEGERINRFCRACADNDIDMMMKVQRRGHDGDRRVKWGIEIDEEGHIVYGKTPEPFDANLTDEQLDRLSSGEAVVKNGGEIKELWQCAGTFERSLEPIDFFCDLVEAWSKWTGIKATEELTLASARVSAAGLGGNIAVFCNKDYIDELTAFLKRAYYDDYLGGVYKTANAKFGTALSYEFSQAGTCKVFSPGEGAAAVSGDFRVPQMRKGYEHPVAETGIRPFLNRGVVDGKAMLLSI